MISKSRYNSLRESCQTKIKQIQNEYEDIIKNLEIENKKLKEELNKNVYDFFHFGQNSELKEIRDIHRKTKEKNNDCNDIIKNLEIKNKKITNDNDFLKQACLKYSKKVDRLKYLEERIKIFNEISEEFFDDERFIDINKSVDISNHLRFFNESSSYNCSSDNNSSDDESSSSESPFPEGCEYASKSCQIKGECNHCFFIRSSSSTD